MSRGQPLDALESAHVLPPLTFGIAQAQTLDAVVAQALNLLDSACAPFSAQIVCAAGLRVLGMSAADLPTQVPDQHVRLVLERGDLSITSVGDRCSVFVPLTASGGLFGWMYLEVEGCSPDLSAWLLTLASQLGPALGLFEATRQHAEQVRHLQILSEVSQIIGGVLDFERLLDAIYLCVSRVIAISNFYLALYESSTDELDLAYVVRAGERLEQPFRWRANAGLAGVIIRRRVGLRTDDYLTECVRQGVSPRPIGELPPGRAWLGVPLIASDVVIGVLNLSNSHDGYRYTDEQLTLLTAIGAQAAVALANARLYQRSERQARQLTALNKIGRILTSSLDQEQVPSLIMEQVCRLLEVAEGSLLLVDEADGDLVFAYAVGPIGAQLLGQRVPRGRGIAGHVVTTGESLIVNDVQGDTRFYDATDKTTGFMTRTMLAVPLRGVTGIKGLIEVMNRHDGGPFTLEDRRLLESVADQAVIALENARRFTLVDQALAKRAEELVQTNALLQHNLQSLTALNALSMAITTSLRDADSILSMTARGVIEASGALGATVLLADQAELRVVANVGMSHAHLPIDAVCRTVLKTGRPERVEYAYPSRRVLLAVPMRAPSRILGVLCVFYEDAAPGPSEQETIVLFATQAAAAIESLDLLAEILGARDQMSSILTSTREGMLLIAPDQRIVHANTALRLLTQIDATTAHGASVDGFFEDWRVSGSYAAEDLAGLRAGVRNVLAGHDHGAFGQLDAATQAARAIEWAVLAVSGDQAERGGALLVLRDITEARKAEHLRHDLTNMIVHDLRSPLSSVMAAIEILTKGISGTLSEGQRNILNIAFSSSLQMLDMINTLLDISRLEAGRMPINLATSQIAPVLDRAASRLASLAQDRSIVIVSDVPDDLPAALLDQELIVRVLQNLLGNAIKFSSRHSTVLVRVDALRAASRPMLRVSVSDRGIGIALNDQAKVFSKFSQVGAVHSGTGLGLTFCKLVVEAHGGSIWLESEPGNGSTFFFTVPLVA